LTTWLRVRQGAIISHLGAADGADRRTTPGRSSILEQDRRALREEGAGGQADSEGPAPLFGIAATNLYRPLVGTPVDEVLGLRHHGLVTFAGGQPVYDCQAGVLLGGVGVSEDEVDQDDAVAKGAVTGAGFCLQP
jgi:Haem-degrading